MSGEPDPTLLERARAAAARCDWQAAYDLLTEAESAGQLSPADLPLLADVAYAAGHLDVTIEVWERAYGACVRAGDAVAAAGAAARVAMHLLFDTALMAPVRGWLTRAEHLLVGQDETPVHAWVAVVRSYERLLVGDLQKAREWARQAIAVGSNHAPAAAAIGRVAEARSLILEGDVQQGLVLLEEAGVATVSGELDPLSTGVVYCELVCALQGLGQYDLAEEWTEAMERWRPTGAIGSIHGRCRVHRAEILRLRGAWDEAEQQALLACQELRPYLRRELGWPLCELGRIRLLKGDVEGAEEALLEADEAGWDPQPGLALVELARGEVALAAAAIRAALAHPSNVPSKELPANTELRRAPLLEAAVEIEIAAGDLDRARSAADELERVAARFESKALAARAALAQGRVRLAEGETTVRTPVERAPGPSERPPGRNAFRREGDFWTVVTPRGSTHVRDAKGMRHLATMLAQPGRPIHVLDLAAGSPTGSGVGDVDEADSGDAGFIVGFGDAGEVLDDAAKNAYRQRLSELEESIGEAERFNDIGRAAQLGAERDMLIEQLAQAVGLGGRDRRAVSVSERARVNVTRAIRSAIRKISELDRDAGHYLDVTVVTGTYCVFDPQRSS